MKPVLLFILLTMLVSLGVSAQDCVLRCPENIVVSTDPGKEGATVNFPSMESPGGCGALTYTPASGSFFRLGSHSVIITSASGKKCSFTVTVTDNEAPELTPIVLSRAQLWPASNKLKKVKLNYTATDNAQEVKTKVTISANDGGSGNWEYIDDHLIRLRSARLPDGSPRVYTITVTATDNAGNKTTRTTTIAVSNTMTAIPVK
jgi:hypothetical protein